MGGRRYQAIGGDLPGFQDFIDNHRAVNRQRQRFAQFGIVLEWRFGQVKANPVGGEEGLYVQLVGVFFFGNFQTFRGKGFDVIHFPGAIAVKGGAFLLNRIVDDFVNGDVVVIPVSRRFFCGNARLRFPFTQVIGAITDDMLWPCPFVAELFDRFARDGIGGVMRHQAGEIRRRIIQFDLQGAPIQCLDAERFNIFFLPAGNRLGIFHRIKNEGIFTAGGGIDRALPGIDKIIRRHRLAIGPFGIVAQMESINFTVIGNFPFFGDAGDDFTFGIGGGQTLEIVINNRRTGIFCRQLRVNAFRLGAIAAAEDTFRLGIDGEQYQRGNKQLFHDEPR